MVSLFTIGHSNRSFEDFLSLLREFEVCGVADIRRYPGSRKFPHFNSEVLCNLLLAEGISYVWFEALGGHRHTAKNNSSPNLGLKSLGFRNYADHMATDEFGKAIEELILIATKSRMCLMCAEKFYWRCHRKLLCDYLIAQGVNVEHIVESGELQSHRLSRGAVITDNAAVIYPLQQSQRFLLRELFAH